MTIQLRDVVIEIEGDGANVSVSPDGMKVTIKQPEAKTVEKIRVVEVEKIRVVEKQVPLWWNGWQNQPQYPQYSFGNRILSGNDFPYCFDAGTPTQTATTATTTWTAKHPDQDGFSNLSLR